MGYINGELRFYLGWAQRIAGDRTAAKESWRQALGELEPFLKKQPQNYALVDDLAMTYTCLVNKAANVVEQATATVPIEKDALIGSSLLFALAEVAAWTGEPDRAIAALQKLLSIPAGTYVTPALLPLDPMFDPLRNDPRFQKLCEEKPK